METQKPTWRLNDDHAINNRFATLKANHPAEYDSLFSNLRKIMLLLSPRAKVGSFRVNFFRSEGGEVYRIGQTGVAGAKESRLYIHPDQDHLTMYILTAGTKDEQSGDIQAAKQIVADIKRLNEGK